MHKWGHKSIESSIDLEIYQIKHTSDSNQISIRRKRMERLSQILSKRGKSRDRTGSGGTGNRQDWPTWGDTLFWDLDSARFGVSSDKWESSKQRLPNTTLVRPWRRQHPGDYIGRQCGEWNRGKLVSNISFWIALQRDHQQHFLPHHTWNVIKIHIINVTSWNPRPHTYDVQSITTALTRLMCGTECGIPKWASILASCTADRDMPKCCMWGPNRPHWSGMRATSQ